MHQIHYISWMLSSWVAATAALPSTAWNLKSFKSLVAFGDSYTDESRLDYFASHNGSAPPVGWVDPINNDTASGGYIWPRFVADYAGVNLYDYAVAGAVCSNLITPRTFSTIKAPFPSVLEYEVPAYIADSKYVTQPGQKFLDIPAQETVYSMWIGTNDLGVDAFLTDSQVANKTISDYLECVYSAFDLIYANGARYFVLMNLAPLQLTPLYATPEKEGVRDNQYWPDKPDNRTEISYRMWEQVILVNEVYKYRTPFELLVARRYPGAHFAVMDMYGLISDIYNNPTAYLNGSAPANVTGYINHCNINGTDCTRMPSPDSYLWFDELHPSQRTDQIIAENFIEVVRGKSKWATYW
ncbi:CAZyme family CE16 [Paecilomyces variotii]|nr:CAZyme family CE16 [Paecilomyces variotii]KAJ9382686.1 CAZyme family CE16 [Paecilomyces variotii]